MESILPTIKELGIVLLALVPISVAVTQYPKEKFEISDKGAEILSLIVGFVLSGLVALAYANDAGYTLELGQWIGTGLFVLLGTIGPSGGYKVIGAFSGSRNVL